MQLVADENIPHLCVERLRAAGHDVTPIADTHPGADDHEVLALAGREERVLLTEDGDFGTLVYAQLESPPVGVIYLRLGSAKPEAVAEALVEVLERTDLEIAGRLTVVEPGRVRQRPLPER
ncbi:MAG: DUF5615 family PIN-like protein [Rubricoccaceae bacterium]|nr:DUF5615 family PIN-like protein [Rubricoccaceae bacterium]